MSTQATPAQMSALAAEHPRYASIVDEALAGDAASCLLATTLMDTAKFRAESPDATHHY